MRLFVAILFTQEVKTGLMNAVSILKKLSVSGDFTGKDNLHITLAFIGETDKIDSAAEAIEEAEAAPFNVRFKGTGNFGDVFWVGIEMNPALNKLAENIVNNLRAREFKIEKRSFKPHITLARRIVLQDKTHVSAVSKSVNMNMRVHRISLMKSERINGKLKYTEIFGKELI